MLSPQTFVQMIQNEINRFKGKTVQYGTIASNHTAGKPSIVFDGDTSATVKKYPYLASYTPTANDRVMVIDGVVVGKIKNS